MAWGQVNGDREFSAAPKQEAERAYTRTYYPGSMDPAKASVISVKEGEEVPGMDIALKETAVYRVRGKVFNQVTRKAGKEVELQLMPCGRRQEFFFGGWGAQVKKSDGSFEIANVVPGSYVLAAYWFDEGKYYTGLENVDIAGSDVEVALSIGAGTAIPGRVRWEGKPSLEGDELQVFLESETLQNWVGISARVGANQQFTLKDVNEGKYRVQTNGLSRDCYIKEVVYGDTRAKDDTISVSKGGGAPLEITLSSRGARVEGAAVDHDGLPAPGAWVVAVPEEAQRGNSRLFKAQTTDQYGKFDLRGLPPGWYKVFSFTGVEAGEWEDPEFLKTQEAKGESVEVRDGDVKTLNLRLIEQKREARE
jgi:protocatechuate 3,4-dioxygenase beta subunit